METDQPFTQEFAIFFTSTLGSFGPGRLARMKKQLAVLFLAAVYSVSIAVAQDKDFQHNEKHVLLISIDGMHAVDLANCAKGIGTVNNGKPYCPAMAALARTGVNYVAASTSKPSDSFPGLTAIITGGSPALTGVYYDVAYSRNYDAPAKTTGNRVGAGPCTPFATPTGTTTEYEEGIDIDQTKVNGGAPGAALTDGLNSGGQAADYIISTLQRKLCLGTSEICRLGSMVTLVTASSAWTQAG